MSIEFRDKWCDYYAPKVVEPQEKLFRITEGENRCYFKQGPTVAEDKYYPNVTAVASSSLPTGEGLIRWMCEQGYAKSKHEARKRSIYGTLLHACISRLIASGGRITFQDIQNEYHKLAVEVDMLANGIDQNDVLKECFIEVHAFKKFMRDYAVEVLMVEGMLTYEQHGSTGIQSIAGTVDLVVRMRMGTGENGFVKQDDIKKGTITDQVMVLDIKSGKNFYEANALQLAFNALAIEQNKLIGEPIMGIANWRPAEDTKRGYSIKVWPRFERLKEEAQIVLDLYYRRNPNANAPRTTTWLDAVIDVEQEGDVPEITYGEWIRRFGGFEIDLIDNRTTRTAPTEPFSEMKAFNSLFD